jgi:DNA polymerase III subunit chi
VRVRIGDRRDDDGVFFRQRSGRLIAMARADFYLIDKPRFRDDPLLLVCELVKKAYAAEQPTLILARTPEQADALDEKLWEFDDESFIPHQIAGDDDDAITAVVIVPPGSRSADRPLVVNLRDECAQGSFERVLEVVAADPAEREGSRARWTEYKKRGFDVNKYDM